jgi:hypothetical protein
MRKLLLALGVLMLTLIVVLGAGFAIVAYKGSALDAESKAFVDEAVPAIASHWDSRALVDRSTAELRRNAPPEKIAQLFATLSRLGPMVHYDGCKGDATMSYFTGTGGTVSAAYVASARFQNGTATFRILLLKRDGRWLIHNFHVDPMIGHNPRQGA